MTTSPVPFRYAVSAFLTVLLLALPAAAAAATAEDDKTPLNLDTSSKPAEAAASSGGGGGIVRMIVGLAVVIGVIYGLSWVMKQVKASKEGQASGSGLAPISSLPLGPNRSVHLVKVGNDLVLLGAAEHGVTPIRSYGEAEARAAGLIGDDEDTDAIAGLQPPKPVAAKAAGNVLEALRQRTVRR
jgi:flagellar protein FliO/FliZ